MYSKNDPKAFSEGKSKSDGVGVKRGLHQPNHLSQYKNITKLGWSVLHSAILVFVHQSSNLNINYLFGKAIEDIYSSNQINTCTNFCPMERLSILPV